MKLRQRLQRVAHLERRGGVPRLDVFYGRTDNERGNKQYGAVVVFTAAKKIDYYDDVYEPKGKKFKVLCEIGGYELHRVAAQEPVCRVPSTVGRLDPTAPTGSCFRRGVPEAKLRLRRQRRLRSRPRLRRVAQRRAHPANPAKGEAQTAETQEGRCWRPPMRHLRSTVRSSRPSSPMTSPCSSVPGLTPISSPPFSIQLGGPLLFDPSGGGKRPLHSAAHGSSIRSPPVLGAGASLDDGETIDAVASLTSLPPAAADTQRVSLIGPQSCASIFALAVGRGSASRVMLSETTR
mmetsp:Transcript_26370/g.81131  ORF Transcript_26370/g.81131 Transcript_26370/m.81131 type:complete len:292 (+) Transcript_26370:447-1322(+)